MAVPTVLGIASIRVYTVSEAAGDGLLAREKVWLSLNVYTWKKPLSHPLSCCILPSSSFSLLTPAERLQPSYTVCSGALSSREARCHRERVNYSERERTAVRTGC